MRSKLTAAIIILFAAISLKGFAENSRTLTDKNDFGGATVEFNYQNGDEFYNKFGIERSVIFYDYGKKIKQVEYYYLPAAAKEKGFTKRIEYYSEKGKVASAYVIHTDEFAQKEKYNQHNEYFDENGQKIRIDYFYTPDFANKKGYDKAVMFLVKGFVEEWDYYYINSYIDQNGISMRKDYYVTDPYGKEKITKTVLYDKDKKEIKNGDK